MFLLSKFKKGYWYEVLEYDKAKNLAVLRAPNGQKMIDINFHIDIIKRCYTMTHEQPAAIPEN